ncbi:MAG: ribonuclease P protein component [Candidatus Omnitrophica bacterium]|nr:ribonuclease P protein component [Candidatus Omnitrophota bacterium]
MASELRLKKPKDFRNVFRKGRRLSSSYFALYACKTDLPQPRLGVSISKAHFKLATRRNRLRRIAREIFRGKITTRPGGHDFVIVSKAACQSNRMREAIADLKKIMQNITGQHDK